MSMILYMLAQILLTAVPLLLCVAFMTLAEREIRASMQRRVGPNVSGYAGLFYNMLRVENITTRQTSPNTSSEGELSLNESKLSGSQKPEDGEKDRFLLKVLFFLSFIFRLPFFCLQFLFLVLAIVFGFLGELFNYLANFDFTQLDYRYVLTFFNLVQLYIMYGPFMYTLELDSEILWQIF